MMLNLTEDEMLQMALDASMKDQGKGSISEDQIDVIDRDASELTIDRSKMSAADTRLYRIWMENQSPSPNEIRNSEISERNSYSLQEYFSNGLKQKPSDAVKPVFAGTGGVHSTPDRRQFSQLASSLNDDVESQAEVNNKKTQQQYMRSYSDHKDAEEEHNQFTSVTPLKPRTGHAKPVVKTKHKEVKRPKRKRERMPSTYFIQSPIRRASEYALAGRQSRMFFGYGMILTCCAVFLVELSLGDWELAPMARNPTIGPDHDVLLKAGAKSTPLILDGEAWRIFSPMVLHSGVVHLVFNMSGLWYLVNEMERTHGWKRLAFIYLASGVFGTLCSAIFVPETLMVGASGAIFGMVGARWADLVQNWSVFNRPWQELGFLFAMTVFNVAMGFMPYLDNFAHLGGLVLGIICGLMLLAQDRVDHYGFSREKKCYQLVLASLAAFVFVILIIGGFVMLYSGLDMNTVCPQCMKLSCVEFPPGSDSYWWDCSDCSLVGFSVTQYSNGSFYLRCPRDGGSKLGFSNLSQTTNDFSYVDFCKSEC